MSVRNSLIVSFLLLSHPAGWAQAPTPDFADGFKRLAALGLPALDAKATWIKHPAADGDYRLRELTKSVKGNAWLIPSPDGKPGVLPLGASEPVTAADGDEKPAVAKPGPPQDLTKDVAAITAAIDKLAAKFDPQELSYRSSEYGFGRFLLFATQLYQNGHPELANPLALAVFKVFPSREAAVDAAIDLLAAPLYQQATRTFFTSGDWAAYHQALTGLSKRFPRGWSNHDAVAMLLPQLAKQAAGAKAPAIALPDMALDPRALECIRQLGDKPAPQATPAEARGGASALRRRMQMRYNSDGDAYRPSSLWLINDDPEAAKNPSPLARLAALKMAALPALAALVTDPFLTHLHNPGSSSGFYSSSRDNEDRTILLYTSLTRPATRGELATQLLTATLPDPQNELNQADPEAIRELALTFWKDHKAATREELAAIFLRDGSEGQAEQAASILASSSDPKAHQAFEAHALAADPAIALYRHVQTYLRARKAAAKPFFEAYAKLVRSQTSATANEDDSPYPRSWDIRDAGGPEKILKQLATLIDGQSPRALAVEIAKGKPADAGTAIQSLTSLLADATPTKHLHALLEGANAATDATIRARFLQASLYVGWGNDEADEESSKDTPAAERKVSEPEAAVWRKLIADTRSIPSGFNPVNRFKQTRTYEKVTVAELAAFALEQTVNSDSYMTAVSASPILGKSVNAILVEQATARLAGKPLPILPDASKITGKRLTEIVAEAAKKSATEVHPYLASLTLDERAAWHEWLDEPGDLPVPASVKSLQQVIVGRLPDGEFPSSPETKGPGTIDIGFNVTVENLSKQIESLATAIDQHSRTIISIVPARFGPGLEAHASLIPMQTQPAKRGTSQGEADDDEEPDGNGAAIFAQPIHTLDANESATGMVLAYLGSREGSSEAIWLVQDGKAVMQQPAEPEAEQRFPFAATLKKVLEADERTEFFLYIEFISRADAAKFKAASTDPATPTEEEE